MPTQVDVCNQALDILGAQSITLISEVSPRAEACARNFDQCLVRLLREAQWNFAKHRVALTATTDPAFGWDNAFTLPSDFVVFVQLNGIEYPSQPGDFYELEGGVLYTDEATADVQYIRKPSLSGGILLADFLTAADPLFIDLLATLLAARIAPALRKDGTDEALRLMDVFKRELTAAKMKDGNERKSERYDPVSESRFIQARYWRTL
jgi:hypothetical protein